MKKKYTREQAYDKLYSLAGRMLKRLDACSKCPIGCGKAYSKSWCCDGCPHLGAQGCKIEALACKLWLCDKEQSRLKHPSRLAFLNQIGLSYGIMIARASKEQSLRLGENHHFWSVYWGNVS